jgi:dipeptidyl aminopeptidase/acylaminoacyl peptidase
MVRRALAILVTAALTAGCSGAPDRPTSSPAPAVSPSASPTPRPDPQSLPALFDDAISGGDLKRSRFIGDFGPYRSWEVTFRSGKLTTSGVLNVPEGDGPFPAVVLNHGYIEPSIYRTGQGMERERDYLARAGFVVLHNDYRGHAGSDDVGPTDLEFRLGYTKDAIAAVKALRGIAEVRDDQVALAGRSMGGGVVFNALVVDPDLVMAAVVWSSVSTRYIDNFRQWTETERPDRAAEVTERWGTVEENPEFWAGLSSRTYFDRIDAAVMMHHGTLDESCPYGWAEATRDALRRADVDLSFRSYEGEHHTFFPQWELSMERTVEFLRSKLGVDSRTSTSE